MLVALRRGLVMTCALVPVALLVVAGATTGPFPWSPEELYVVLSLAASLGFLLEGSLGLAERSPLARRLVNAQRQVQLAVFLAVVAFAGATLSLGNFLLAVSLSQGRPLLQQLPSPDQALLGIAGLVVYLVVPWASTSWLRLRWRDDQATVQIFGAWALGALAIALFSIPAAFCGSLVIWNLVTLGLGGVYVASQWLAQVGQRLLHVERVRALQPHTDQTQVLALLGDPDAEAMTGESPLTLDLQEWARRLNVSCPQEVRLELQATHERSLAPGDPRRRQRAEAAGSAAGEGLDSVLVPAAWALDDVATLRALIDPVLRDWAQAELPAELKR